MDTNTTNELKDEMTERVKGFWHLKRDSFTCFVEANKESVKEWTASERAYLEKKCLRMFGDEYVPPWKIQKAIWFVRFFKWVFGS